MGVFFLDPAQLLDFFDVFVNVGRVVLHALGHFDYLFDGLPVAVEALPFETEFLLQECVGLLQSPPLYAELGILAVAFDLAVDCSWFVDEKLVDFAGFFDVVDVFAEQQGVVLGLRDILQILEDVGDEAEDCQLFHEQVVELTVNFVMTFIFTLADVVTDFSQVF